MSDFTIRPYEETDRDRVLDIAVAGWEPIYGQFREILGDDLFAKVYPDWAGTKREQVRSAIHSNHGPHALVAVSDDKVVAFITYYFRDPKLGEIGLNAVDPAYQKRGIASTLYKRAIDDMRASGMKVAKVITGGDPSHAPARAAYAKAGFETALPFVTYYKEL